MHTQILTSKFGAELISFKLNGEERVHQGEEIADIKWVDVGYATSVLTYENDKSIVNKAKKVIKD